MNILYKTIHSIANISFLDRQLSQLVLAALTTLSLLLGVISVLNLLQICGEKNTFKRAYATKLDMELSIQAQTMLEQSVQVGQWLIDIAATRGLDNLDEGFTLARQNALLFQKGLPILNDIIDKYQIISRSWPKTFCFGSPLPSQDSQPSEFKPELVEVPTITSATADGVRPLPSELKNSIANLEEEFKVHYQTGLEMAKIYIKSGTLHGNELMKKFLTNGEVIEAKLTPFIRPAKVPHAGFPPTPPPLDWFGPASIWKLIMGQEFYLSFVQSKKRIFDANARTSYTQLAYQAQKLRLAILSIQNGLTSVSVTRARNGMDEGFSLSKKHRDEFHADLTSFRQLLGEESDPFRWMAFINTLQRRADFFYHTGLDMADAYIRGEAELGNPIMAIFDGEAARLTKMLDPFLSQSLEKTGLGEYQVNFSFQAINNTLMIIQILIATFFIVFVTSGWLLYRSIQQYKFYNHPKRLSFPDRSFPRKGKV